MREVRYLVAGQPIRLMASFLGADDELADPDAVVVKVITPTGQEATHVPNKDETGVYHYDYFTTATPGRYQYRFEGSGAVHAAHEWEFRVRRTSFSVV